MGSNLGNREGYLKQAIAHLAQNPGIEVVRCSRFYDSEPKYFRDQPRFLNCVIEIRTRLMPDALLQICQSIEETLGREKSFRYGPRVIDLDILFYGLQVIQKPNLQIPHPHLRERRFVLEPLCELNPDWEHPGLKKSVKQLLDAS